MNDNWGRSLWDRSRAELLHAQSQEMFEQRKLDLLYGNKPYVPTQCQACGARYTLTKRGVHVCGYCGSEK